MKTAKTSWGGVALWYDQLLEDQGKNYQKDVILPNLLRCMAVSALDHVLDLACGQGFFSRALANTGATVTASDISPELIAIAKKADDKTAHISYHVAPAHELDFVTDGSLDHVLITLAIQNMSNPLQVFRAAARKLKRGGVLTMVMNHPAFRVPGASDWGWDEQQGIQYRRVDRYLTEFKKEIQMHPGSKPDEITFSYQRPLQFFVKSLARSGLLISNLEEWTTDRKSDSGPRAKAENFAKKEFPLFMLLQATKIS